MAYAQYTYDGPVYEFDDMIHKRWIGTTYAVSEKKARSNLAYQFRKQYNMETETRVTLPGKLTRV